MAVENATLVVSELVTNALDHGAGAIELSLRVDTDKAVIEVADQGLGARLEASEAHSGMTRGWGLRIVEQVSSRWGVLDGATRVWAEVPLR